MGTSLLPFGQNGYRTAPFLGVPKTGDKTKSGYLTLAF